MTLPLMYGTCFSLSILSALFPWMNGEVLMLSYSTFADSSVERIILVLMDSWRNRFVRYSQKPMWLVFISSVSGIPPFYVITVLTGAFRIRFSRFITVGACGRLVHFGAVALVPQFFPQLSNYLDNLF
jgi:hypothetical protein